jgi:SAM-dependent methyltransferase
VSDKLIWHDPDPTFPGADRRHPITQNPAYLTLRLLRHAIEHFATQVIPNGTLLDLGCGDAPYTPLFDEGINYVSVDRGKRYPIRVVADITTMLPFIDETFDAVLCTQVLEHISNPEMVVNEIYRVLKPQGIGFISVPFAWEIHQYPEDCHRFTPDELKSLFREFSHCEVEPLEPSDLAWIQSKLIRWHRANPESHWRKFIISRINRWMWRRKNRFQDKSHPGNLIVHIQK